MSEMAIGVAVGFALSHFLNRWAAMWRLCCRAHYLTHETCLCRDCERERTRGRAA